MAVDEFEAVALMPLETPILKVSRPVAACSRCRNAKIKCDGKLPACSSCEKNGRAAECTSTNEEFAKGKERSYVATLETRIDKLQARLEDARRRKPSVVSIPDDETAVPSRRPSVHNDEPPTPNTSRKLRRKEASAIDDLVSDFGFLSVNATARDFYGFTESMSYARLILWSCAKDPLPQGTTKALPQRFEANRLIQHFLDNMFALLPVFDEATFYASVDGVYSPKPQAANAFDHWTVRMVLAIASASISEQRGDQLHLEAVGHVTAALQHAEGVLHPGSIQSIQALVLLTEYAMLDPHHFDSWSLIGAASRAMVDLGLHQDPPKGAPMTKAKLELRRKVFHCVYVLDRSTSMVQTRAFSFSDDSAKVKIPFSKAQSAPGSPAALGEHAGGLQPSWLNSRDRALDFVSIRQIQSGWYTDLFQSGRSRWENPYPYLWKACDEMRSWFENISPSTSHSMKRFFELDLLYSYVYMLSPSPRVPVAAPYAQTLVFEYCIRYTDLLLQLASDPAYTAPLTFYDAMRVYMTGRQFLDVLGSSMDMLINGQVAKPPAPSQGSPSAPKLPPVALPTGESVPRFNVVRAINCIKRIGECLTRFGVRFGYMSWKQRFENETAVLFEELSQRLRDMDEADSRRRPSSWQHNSFTGSVSSVSSGTNTAALYQQSLHDSVAGVPTYQKPDTLQRIPSYGQQQSGSMQPPPAPHQQMQPSSFTQSSPVYAHAGLQPFTVAQPQFSNFQFHQPSYQTTPPRNVAPTHQFAQWQGYGGPSASASHDDEDNAIPPNANWAAPP